MTSLSTSQFPLRLLPLLACALAAVSVVGCGPNGPAKHPVTGVVRVNGQPAERMVVQLAATGKPPPGNLAFPTGVTDEDGKFALSSEGERDGAVEGEFTVVFSWLSSPGLDAFDMFGGAFSDPKTTKYKLTIPSKEPIEFDLIVPESAIKRPKGSR